jgi:type I restriction enzyme, S subunit
MESNLYFPILPEGWTWTTLREVIQTIESGGRPKGGARGIEEGVPSLGGEHLLYSGGFNFKEIRYVPVDFFAKMTKGKIRRYDILVVKDGATTGKTSFVGDDFPFENAAINEHVFIIRPIEILLSKYLFYWFQSPFGQECVADNFRGAAQGGITLGILDNSRFPLPPLPEQERIVARLEELLSDLEAGAAALERARVGLKRYKTSVLKAACEGRLGRQKDQVEMGEDGLPKGWKFVRLGLIAEVRLGRQRSPSRAQGPNMKPYMRAANVTWDGIDLSDVKEMDFSPREQETYRLKPGDILLSEASGSISEVGKPAIWRNEIPESYIQNTLIRVRPYEDYSEYLYFHFLYDALTERFRKIAKGVGIHHLGAENMSNWLVSLPPLAEQRRIVVEVERRMSMVKQLESVLERMLVHSTRLREAVLKRAFEGKLVSQNPNDVPVEILLEHIKEARKLEDTQAKTEPRKVKEKKMSTEKKRQSLYATLMATNGARLTPDQLFKASGYETEFRKEDNNQEVLEAFYEELRAEIQLGHITEERPNNKDVYLKGVKS